MKIVIPTHNRSDNVVTLNSIPSTYYKDTYLVVREGEQYEKYKHYEDIVNVVSFQNLSGIHDKRHAICKHFAGEKIWMVDDDCSLHPAAYNAEKDIIRADTTRIVDHSEFDNFIIYSSDLLDKYPHGVIRPTIFPRGKSYWPYRLNTWAFTNVMLNLGKIDADLLRYDKFDHSEDLYAMLNVIDAGHDSFCLSKWMIKTVKPGNPGGMTGVRSVEMMNVVAKEIHREYPQYTKIETGYRLNGMNEDPLVLRVRIRKKPNE